MITHREQINFDSILLDTNAKTVKQVLEELAFEAAKKVRGTSAEALKKILFKSEKEAPSGIGNGIALPHMQIKSITRPITILMKMPTPISFEGIDDMPADIACLLISPEKDGVHHLRRLSRLSRLLRNPKFCDSIRHSNDDDELQHLFVDSQKQLLVAA